MAPKSKKGKIFMQDKDKLLQLAETVSLGSELVTRHRVDRTKAVATSRNSPSKRKDNERRKRGSRATPDRLRAAKEQVAARQSRHKREKLKARKGQGPRSSNKDAQITRGSGGSNIMAGREPGQKRVSFA